MIKNNELVCQQLCQMKFYDFFSHKVYDYFYQNLKPIFFAGKILIVPFIAMLCL